MRFACQSCGKAYNLPEEKIAEKSNVKLKCRVCGALVEVKRHGEIVAHLLGDTEAKRGSRVSDAPAPLASMAPEAEVSSAESSFEAGAGLDYRDGVPVLPAPPPTGFSSPASTGLAPLPPPPPRSEPMARLDPNPPVPPLPSTPPPLDLPAAPPVPPPMVGGGWGPSEPVVNGSNAAPPPLAPEPAARPAEPVREPAPPMPPAQFEAAAPAAVSEPVAAPPMAPAPSTTGESDDTNKKMLAAFVTGIVVDRVFSGLFF